MIVLRLLAFTVVGILLIVLLGILHALPPEPWNGLLGMGLGVLALIATALTE